jgi:MFS family permease
MGLLPDGERVREDDADGVSPRPFNPDAVEFTIGEALRTPQFWFISLGHASALLIVSAVIVHLIPDLIESLGYSLEEAAVVLTAVTLIQIVGQVGGGFIGDRISKRVIVIVCMGMHCVGLLLLANATSFWMVAGFAVLHGLAWGVRGPLMQAIRADYYGRGSFGKIMGFSSLIVMLGSISGPLVAGVLYDATQSYAIGFTVLAVLAGLGSIFFVFSTRPKPPARFRQTLGGAT